MSLQEPAREPQKINKLNLNIDLRLVVVVLLLAIAGMLYAWKPWAQSATNNDRTITVSGEVKLKAEPDEFVFQPTYEFKDVSKEVALDSLTKKSAEIVKKLKELGVPENKIKTNSDGYNYPEYYPNGTSDIKTYSLHMTITVDNRELTQKVQDYLIKTSPSGQVSPQTSFSEEKRKELEASARDGATKDARAKADQSAKNLGFKVGKVKSIDDGTAFGGIDPLQKSSEFGRDLAESKLTSLNIQPGEDTLNYTVTVVYYIR